MLIGWHCWPVWRLAAGYPDEAFKNGYGSGEHHDDKVPDT